MIKNLSANAGGSGDENSIPSQKVPWRRNWQPSTVFMPEKPHGQSSLEGSSSWVHRESDTTVTACTHVAHALCNIRIIVFKCSSEKVFKQNNSIQLLRILHPTT